MIYLKPNTSYLYGDLAGIKAIEPPLWLAVIRGRGRLIDAEAENLSFEETIKVVGQEEVVMLPTGNNPSSQFQQFDECYKIRQRVKNCKIYKTLPYIDERLSPNWEGLDLSKYRCHEWHGNQNEGYGVVYASMSCPYKCSFCHTKSWYDCEYRVRDTKDVIRDIEFWDTKNIKIIDELFLTEHQIPLLKSARFDKNIWAYARLDRLCELELARRFGITWLAVGIESGNQAIRQSNGKGNLSNKAIEEKIQMIKDAGIKVVGNFIFGFPQDTKDTMQETLDFAMKLKCEYANFYSMMPLPGTALYAYGKFKKWEVDRTSEELSQYSYQCKPIQTNWISSEEVLAFRDYAIQEYYGGKYERMERQIQLV